MLRVAEWRRQFLRLQSILPMPPAPQQEQQQFTMQPGQKPGEKPGQQPGKKRPSGGDTAHTAAGDAPAEVEAGAVPRPLPQAEEPSLDSRGSGGSDDTGAGGWELVGAELMAGGGSFYGMLTALHESCR